MATKSEVARLFQAYTLLQKAAYVLDDEVMERVTETAEYVERRLLRALGILPESKYATEIRRLADKSVPDTDVPVEAMKAITEIAGVLL